jgi:hypothetical protein
MGRERREMDMLVSSSLVGLVFNASISATISDSVGSVLVACERDREREREEDESVGP